MTNSNDPTSDVPGAEDNGTPVPIDLEWLDPEQAQAKYPDLDPDGQLRRDVPHPNA